jgi:polysaccharide chain length determinant protein (PEP-CTERM system associated)
MQNWKLRFLGQLTGAWQNRWYGLAVAFLVCACGWFAVAMIPNTFESEAKVYIDTDTLLRPLLKGLAVTTDADQEVNVMLRTLLSDTNVERVVRATDPDAANLSPTALRDKIASIQRRVVLRDLGTANLYNISFRDSDPRYAQTVTQSLLSVLIDSNLGSQRHDTESAQSFLDGQIADYERKLAEADKRRADFKASHISYFSNGNDNALDAGGGVASATIAVSQAQTVLDEAVARRNSIRAQVAGTQATIDVNAPDSAFAAGGGGSGLYGQLALARTKLAELRTHYTEQYPDVIAQKNMVARLQAEIASSPAGGNTQGIANPAYTALRSKLADEEANVAVAQERLAEAVHRLQVSKGGAVDALGVERQYQDINRDYQVLRDNYQQLVARREAANISQAAGTQQSATFRVIDPPLKPDRPIAPNRRLFNFIVLVLGLGAGIAVALAINMAKDQFMDADKLGTSFSIPVIGTVTACESASDLAQTRRAAMLFGGGVVALMLSYLIVLLLFHTQLAVSQGGLL